MPIYMLITTSCFVNADHSYMLCNIRFQSDLFLYLGESIAAQLGFDIGAVEMR